MGSRLDDKEIRVSMKRPLCVYFDRAMKLIQSELLDSNLSPEICINFVGTGSAIARCTQVARYTSQQVSKRYACLIESVDKSKKISYVSVSALSTDDSTLTDETVFSMVETQKMIPRIDICVNITRCT